MDRFYKKDLPSGTETLLFVDDDTSAARSLRVVLEELGYTLFWATNGIEALAMVDRHDGPIHLTFLDLHMPEMDGITALPLLREKCSEMKIVLLSGSDQEVLNLDLMKKGADGFLFKPIRISELALFIRDFLDQE